MLENVTKDLDDKHIDYLDMSFFHKVDDDEDTPNGQYETNLFINIIDNVDKIMTEHNLDLNHIFKYDSNWYLQFETADGDERYFDLKKEKFD